MRKSSRLCALLNTVFTCVRLAKDFLGQSLVCCPFLRLGLTKSNKDAQAYLASHILTPEKSLVSVVYAEISGKIKYIKILLGKRSIRFLRLYGKFI